MLKTIESIGSAANFEKTEGKIGGNSVVGNSMVDGSEATNPTKGKNQVKTTKSKILVKSKNHNFLSLGLRKPERAFLPPKLG